MSNLSDNVNNILSHKSIVKRAEEKWNLKSSVDKVRSGHKYRHIFEKLKSQVNILVKGELIRTYDSMSNKDKTHLKERFGLSSFSSKWFRLPSCDKKILLNSILKNE